MTVGHLQPSASRRNRVPILRLLMRLLPGQGLVLEVGSGSGEHVAYFARRLPRLTWQASDPAPENRAEIVAVADSPNILPPLDLDMRAGAWPVKEAAAVLAINVIHAAPWAACLGLMAGAAGVLPAHGILYLYGAYRVGSRHTTPGNAAFDAALRRRHPEWGVRDLEAVVAAAQAQGLCLAETVAMPNDNLSVVLRKGVSRRRSGPPA